VALYLLHSTVPLVRVGGVEVRHYIGFARDANVMNRVLQHRHSKAHCSITRAFLRAGGRLLLARVWAGATRADERRLKNGGHYEVLCPICNPDRNPPGDVGSWRARRPKKS